MPGMSATIQKAGRVRVPGSAVHAAEELSCPYLIVRHQTYTNPVVAAATAILAAGVAGPNATTITVLKASFDGVIGTSGLLESPHGRNVTVNVTHATSIVAVNGVISGLGMYGEEITETWSVTATGTDKTYTGSKCFRRVDQITIIAAGNASADTVKAGFGTKMGLDAICVTARLLAEEEDGANPTAGAIVKGVSGSATADRRGSYTPNTAQNGAHDYDVWYVVEDVTTVT